MVAAQPRVSLQRVVFPLCVVALFFVQVALNLSLTSLHVALPDQSEQESAARWNPDVFRTLTFGHWPSGIDWLWIKTLTDPRITHVPKGTHPAIYYTLDLATELDPAFFDLYYWGAHLLAVIRDDGPGARDLLIKAERFRKNSLPTSPESFKERYWAGEWNIPFLQAYVYLFELNEIRAAGKYFSEAAALPGAPSYLKHLAQRFEKPGGEYEVGLRLLTFMIDREVSQGNEIAKKRLEAKRVSLYISQYLFHQNEAFEKFLKNQRGFSPSHPMSLVQRQDFFKKFMKASGSPSRDPFGGTLVLDEQGQIGTTTPRQKVFGLE